MANSKFAGVVKDWLAPGASAFVLCLMAWVRMEFTLVEHEKAIEEMRVEQLRIRRPGPDGFLDPSFGGVLDSHVLRWHERQLGRKGWRKLLTDYENGDDR